MDDHDSVRKKVRAAFAVVLAEHVRRFASDHPVEGFIVAAPARLLGPLKAELKDGPPVLGTLAKDIAGVADHDLGEWLVKAELQAPA
jgi:protein required for attachment to host cells